MAGANSSSVTTRSTSASKSTLGARAPSALQTQLAGCRRCFHRVDADEPDRASDERIDGGGEFGAADQASRRDRASVTQAAQNVGEGGAADAVNGAVPPFASEGSARTVADLATPDDPHRAAFVKPRRLLERARRGDGTVAPQRKVRDRLGADATGRAGDQNVRAGFESSDFEGEHARHGGKARCADDHRLACADSRRQRTEIARWGVHERREAPVARDAERATVHRDRSTRRKPFVDGIDDDASGVDTPDEARHLPHAIRGTGDHGVLEVDGRVIDLDKDVVGIRRTCLHVTHLTRDLTVGLAHNEGAHRPRLGRATGRSQAIRFPR